MKTSWVILLSVFSVLMATRDARALDSETPQIYLTTIKPIFEEKCFNCHSNQTRYPWYYKFPIIKTLIDQDIENARDHIDMSTDFPFQGHGTPREVLQAIRRVVRKGIMPPFLYRLGHWDSKLT